MTFLQELPVAAQIAATVLIVFLLLFLALFLLPGIRQHWKLRRLNRSLARANKEDPKALTALFARDKTSAHLWREYWETLHGQKELDTRTGSYEVARYRSTVLAEIIFSAEALVDSKLRTEFFKHLPGIFTGIGIIGTFLGLINGLHDFKVVDDANLVRTSLNALVMGVREAFFVSLFAIFLAMVITAIEKWMISGLYKRAEQLCQLIDGMFVAGAGEEYLARLVHSSESAEKETKILKDALVTEMKQILEGLTERQIQQASLQSQALADRIMAGLNEGLREPLTKIGNAVESVGGNQTGAVNRLLTDTMSALTAQIRDLFGDQISGINRMQQETINALQNSLARLDELGNKLGAAGQSANEQMAQQISEAIAGMETRQRVINAELTKAVTSIRSEVSESQAETNRKMQEAITGLGTSVTEMVRALQSQVDEASARDQARSEVLAEHARTTQEAMSGSMEKTLAQVAEVGESIKQAVARMEQVTIDAISRMNEGANTLYIASSDFAKAGDKTSETLERANALTGQLATASSALTGSANTLASAVSDYKSVRDEVSRLVQELRATVEAAKTEASFTADVLARIEGAAQKLVNAERQAEGYLEQVTGVLSDAHQAFADNVVSTLREANREFHQHLTTATKMLGQNIDELSEAFDRSPTRQ